MSQTVGLNCNLLPLSNTLTQKSILTFNLQESIFLATYGKQKQAANTKLTHQQILHARWRTPKVAYFHVQGFRKTRLFIQRQTCCQVINLSPVWKKSQQADPNFKPLKLRGDNAQEALAFRFIISSTSKRWMRFFQAVLLKWPIDQPAGWRLRGAFSSDYTSCFESFKAKCSVVTILTKKREPAPSVVGH